MNKWKIFIWHCINQNIVAKRSRFLISHLKYLRNSRLHLSEKLRNPVLEDETPIPWLTSPAIEFLMRFNLSGLNFLEFGAGNSTFFWQDRCKSVLAFEHDEKWINYLKPKIDGNLRINLVQRRPSSLPLISTT